MVSRSYERRPAKKSLANEVLAVAMVALAILLLLSLVTYDPKDLSWNSTGPDHAPSNLIGQVGAHVSDFLLQLFGLAAFAIPILLGLLGGRYFFSDGHVPRRKLIGSILMVVALAGFLALFPDIGLGLAKNSRNGGAGGFLIKEALASLMNTAGAAIVLTAATILTLILTMEISLSGVFGVIADKLKMDERPGVFAKLRDWWIERRIARRAQAALRHQHRLENRRVEETRRIEPEVSARRVEVSGHPAARRSEHQASNAEHDTTPIHAPASLSTAPQTQAAPSNSTAANVEEAEQPARRMAFPRLRARAASIESSKPADPNLDPDVAEMVATASIVRTVPSTVVSSAKLGGTARQRKPEVGGASGYTLPAIDILDPPIGHHEEDEDELRERATAL